MAIPSNARFSKFLHDYGWDLLLGSISTFYVLMVPYTKVEESFNVQAMHDVLYHQHHIEQYDHLDFPGVVSRTFIGALIISTLASPVVLLLHLLHLSKIYSLIAVRLVLGCMVLSAFRFLRLQVKRKFGQHVEAFFVIVTALQFHLLFYSSRPLPNILAFALVTVAYSFWFKGYSYAILRCLIAGPPDIRLNRSWAFILKKKGWIMRDTKSGWRKKRKKCLKKKRSLRKKTMKRTPQEPVAIDIPPLTPPPVDSPDEPIDLNLVASQMRNRLTVSQARTQNRIAALWRHFYMHKWKTSQLDDQVHDMKNQLLMMEKKLKKLEKFKARASRKITKMKISHRYKIACLEERQGQMQIQIAQLQIQLGWR